ncbi:MAG: glycosyltransferase [Planctomycetes bacterium]|nr:glycosyltransferase [Planctomycetota bacterium]
MIDERARVPHLLHVFATFAPAGPQVRTVGLMRAFGRAFRHSVVALDGDTRASALVGDDVEVHVLQAPPKASTPRTVLALRQLLIREAPDLVLTYNFGALDAVIAAKLASLPCIHHEDGFNPDEAGGLKARRVWLRRAVLPGVHAVIVISEKLQRIARESYRLPSDLVHFVPNGIDLERFAPAPRNSALRRELGIPDAAFVVGGVGHLRAEKNFARLLDAAARARDRVDVHVLLLGDGPMRAELERLAARPELAGRVHFAGYHADPRAHYRAMDAFAISSDTEQQPLALLEAMACGLPVVATDVGDVRAMLAEPNRGAVHALGTDVANRLADSLFELARDPVRTRALGAANRAAVAARFDARIMRATYRELYEAALGPRSGSRLRITSPRPRA